ncbi:Glycosyltransferase involved in cell wall bisynthesis [Mucilaginibacter sp. OK268]|uniref:glycosyltransferase family 2 protein n=1 Tax=Mucilaginibacter sp. OK268 TaxID=1881048 RepID=UPI000881C360|nr:glycosyltransferase family 2 protein [Mucilaginibacter sp. OK268]SDQ00100.1 Glycosyltransferase involved in cell wall bisynthesis [Mucilaginibacter sp. OK268]
MKFTIAIPVYNGEKSILKTIECALNQDFPFPYEVLISNNGSKDGTAAIIEPYSSRVKIISRADTVPMYENHNICLREAQGNYVIYCHADDVLFEDSLSKYYDILQKRNFPEKYVLWGRSMFRDFYSNWKEGGIGLNNVLAGQKAVIPFLLGGLAPSGVCYSRKSLLQLGGFCSANLRLTPFDMTTMLKMAIENFEFEMSDRIFFNRRFATTAVALNFKLVKESVYDGFSCLKKELTEDQYRFLISTIVNCKIYDPFLYNFLLKEKLVKKSATRKHIIKKALKAPSLLFNLDFYTEIKSCM